MAKTLNTLSDSALTEILQGGGVGVLPTDTVYGLVCRAADTAAVGRLYALKNRDKKPGTVIAASTDQLIDLGLKGRYIHAVEQFWHDGLTIVIPSAVALPELHQGKMSLACRVVHTPQSLQRLLKKTGALLTTSANLPGEKPADTIAEAQAYFGDQVDFYVDGGDLTGQKPSTLIRIVDDAVEILRQGAVKIHEETGKIL